MRCAGCDTGNPEGTRFCIEAALHSSAVGVSAGSTALRERSYVVAAVHHSPILFSL
jgi:hypothetical protein